MADDTKSVATLLLADALTQARVTAGLSRVELAEKLSVSRSLVAVNENAAQFPSQMYVTGCDRVLETGGRLERLRVIAAAEKAVGFFADLLDSEARATSVSSYLPVLVPGLLQTPEYAAAVISGGIYVGLSDQEVTDAVAKRMERQKILDHDDPPQLWAVLNEAVLHQVVGSPEIMRGQFEHLLHLIRIRRNVRVQILPFREGRHALAQALTIFDLSGNGRVAYLDGLGSGGRSVTDSRTVSLCVEWFDMLRAQAASLTESERLIEQRVKEL